VFENTKTQENATQPITHYFPRLQIDIQNSGAIEYVLGQAEKHKTLAVEALEIFEKNQYWEAAVALADFTINRAY